MRERTDDGKEISFVRLNHVLTALVIDHKNKKVAAWSLVGGKWVAVDTTDAFYTGHVEHGMTMDGLPPLPTNGGTP